MNNDPISDFLKAVEAAAIERTDVYSDDAVLDVRDGMTASDTVWGAGK